MYLVQPLRQVHLKHPGRQLRHTHHILSEEEAEDDAHAAHPNQEADDWSWHELPATEASSQDGSKEVSTQGEREAMHRSDLSANDQTVTVDDTCSKTQLHVLVPKMHELFRGQGESRRSHERRVPGMFDVRRLVHADGAKTPRP